MLVLLGVNHGSAPVEIRERMAVSDGELPAMLGRLTALDGIDEALLLCTCNRVEVLSETSSLRKGMTAIRRFLVEERQISPEEIDRYSYHHHGGEAVRHLLRVAAGLDSMILGEPQITGQVKHAYLMARQAGTTGTMLEHVLQQTLATAKRIRSETGISREPVSIASAAVVLARQIFGDLGGRSALLLGAGKMAALVATHLVAQGVGRVVVASRTFNRAVTLARRFGGEALNWDSALGALDAVDIMVSGTAAPGLVVSKADVQRAVRGRRKGALFLIDIAVPRDVDPAVNELDNVYLYDVDDLQGVVNTNLDSRRRAAEAAESIVEEQVAAFEHWTESLKIAPTIVSLRETLLAVGEAEIERFRKRLGPLDASQEEAVRQLARAIIQKVLHRPIRHLKASAERGDTAAEARLFQELFGIGLRASTTTQPAQQEGEVDSQPPEDGGGPRRLLRGGKEG